MRKPMKLIGMRNKKSRNTQKINKKHKTILCAILSLLITFFFLVPLLPNTSAEIPSTCNFTLKWSTNLDDYYPIKWGPAESDYCYASNVPPVAADINDDGWMEIFVCIGYDHDIREPPLLKDEGTLYALNPHTGDPFWAYHCDDFGSHTVLSLHDLDGDGDLEVLATGYHNITAFHAQNGKILWNKNNPNNREDKPALVIKENGNIWVYTCQNRYDVNQKTIQKRWGKNGSIAKEAEFPGPLHPCHGGLSCADVNNDGKLEIISVDRNYGADYTGLSCWTLDLKLLWSQPGISCSTSCAVLADQNNDGCLDVIVEPEGGVYVLDGKSGMILKGSVSLGLPTGEVYTPAVYDIDKDGHLEVIASDGGAAKVFDLVTWTTEATLKRWDGSSYLRRSPIIANVYGDSTMEMVFGTAAGIQLVRGTHASYQIVAYQNDIHTCSDRMLIQDIDSDGKNEIIALAHGTGYGYGSYNFVYCYNTEGTASSGTSSKDFLYSYRRIAVAENTPAYDPESQVNYYTITLNNVGKGTITKNPNKTSYVYGDVVTLTATADSGWTFSQWSGWLSGTQNPTTVTMKNNIAITATFKENGDVLTISNVVLRSSSPLDTDSSYGWVNISCTVTNNSALNTVRLLLKNPSGSWSNLSMVKRGTNTYYYKSSTAFSKIGDYTYKIWVRNVNSVVRSSNNYAFSMSPNWDMNNDGECNVFDQVMISLHYGEAGSPGWIREDADNNGRIQVADLLLVSSHYGENWLV
jgi:hypothetical protein